VSIASDAGQQILVESEKAEGVHSARTEGPRFSYVALKYEVFGHESQRYRS
jgi:hypothetical protein